MNESPASPAFPSPEHDHELCIASSMQRARDTFTKKRMRLTPLRERVLEVILASHKPIGAYEVAHRLATQGARVAPVSVYRVIDTLLVTGLVRKLQSQNAFFASHGWHQARPKQLVLVCKACGSVAETDGERVFSAINSSARLSGFVSEDAVVELFGLCSNCAD
jgi:Fur family transcriptional regulator, zinc uptake regulator